MRPKPPTSSSARDSARPSLVDDTRGSVFTEYVAVLVLVALVVAAGIGGAGVALLRHHEDLQRALLLPVP